MACAYAGALAVPLGVTRLELARSKRVHPSPPLPHSPQNETEEERGAEAPQSYFARYAAAATDRWAKQNAKTYPTTPRRLCSTTCHHANGDSATENSTGYSIQNDIGLPSFLLLIRSRPGREAILSAWAAEH